MNNVVNIKEDEAVEEAEVVAADEQLDKAKVVAKDEPKEAGQELDPLIQRAIDKSIKAAMIAMRREEHKAQRDAFEVQKQIREAENRVRPWVGQLELSFDSAEQVYEVALQALGVEDLDTVHPSAYRKILEVQPIPGSKVYDHYHANNNWASEEASMFLKRHPGAARIGKA